MKELLYSSSALNMIIHRITCPESEQLVVCYGVHHNIIHREGEGVLLGPL